MLLLGAKWSSAGAVLSVLAFRGMPHSIERTLGWLHVTAGRTDRWMRWGVFATCAQFLALFCGLPFGPMGVAVAYVVAMFVLFVPAIGYAGAPLGISASDAIRIVWRPTRGRARCGGTVLSAALDMAGRHQFSSQDDRPGGGLRGRVPVFGDGRPGRQGAGTELRKRWFGAISRHESHNCWGKKRMTRSVELWLVRLTRSKGDAILRLLVGYVVVPIWLAVAVGRASEWTLIPWFLGVLAALRLAPVVLRRVIRFTDSARAEWATRRRLAKRFDSYQWQKLFWTGLGLGLYRFVSGYQSRAQLSLTLACLVSGTLGLVIWSYRRREVANAVPGIGRSGEAVPGTAPSRSKIGSEA